ncbi:MAG: protein phosphatase 2C domain-containing protein [Caldilineaceae bacterium]
MPKAESLKRAPLKASKTHEGVAGKLNQDSHTFLRVGPGYQEDWEAKPEQSLYVVAVADGVTSQAAGADASGIALRTLERVLRQPPLAQSITQWLDDAIRAANAEILEAIVQHPEQRGMSTTLVVAVIQGWQLYVAHLGDSRAYLMRANTVNRLTLDHSWVQEALDAGRLNEMDAKQHPNRHTILRHLGATRGLEIDHTIIRPGTDQGPTVRQMELSILLEPGDILLLCSDGVTEKVAEAQLLKTIKADKHHPKRAVRQLIQNALDQEETDNITAALLVMPENGLKNSLLRTGLDLKTLSVLTVLLMALLVVGVWMVLATWPQAMNLPGGTRAARAVAQAPLPATPTPSARQPISDTASPTVALATVTTPPSPTPTTQTTTPALGLSVTPAAAPAVTPTPSVAMTPLATATAKPTSTRVATATSTPSPTPTPTPIAVATVGPSVKANSTSGSAECTPCTVTLLGPLADVLTGGQVFAWHANNFELGARYLFEMVFWEDGQDPLRDGRSPIGAGGASNVKVDLDKVAGALALKSGEYYRWGVLLVDASNTRHRLKYLGGNQRFLLQVNYSSNSNGNSDGHSGGDSKPTETPKPK